MNNWDLFYNGARWYWYAWDDKHKRWQFSEPFENYDDALAARDKMINERIEVTKS